MLIELRYWALSCAAWLLRIPLHSVLTADTEAGIVDEEVDGPVEDNPFLEPETSQVVRSALDADMAALWPIIHVNQQAAIQAAKPILVHQLHILNGISKDTFSGAAWELSKLFVDYMASAEGEEPVDIHTFLGADLLQAPEEVEQEQLETIRPEIYAFIAESMDGNHEGAVRVFDAVYAANAHNEALAIYRQGELFTHLVLSLAHRFSLEMVPGLAEVPKEED